MGSKAEIFKTDAINAGWKAEIKTKGNLSTVIAKRKKDGATLSITWDGEKCLNETTITIAGHTRKLRNAAAGRRELIGETIMPKDPGSKPSKPKKKRLPDDEAPPSNSDEDDETPQIPTPQWGFVNAAAPAEHILEAVRGKTITWINASKHAVESATVLGNADQRQLRVETSPVNSKRLLTFAARGEGFRSVYIDRIVSVG